MIKSSLDTSSRIIQKNNRFVVRLDCSRGKNYNNLIRNRYINSCNYKNRSKWSFVCFVEPVFRSYLDSLNLSDNGVVITDGDGYLLHRYLTKYNNRYSEKISRRMKFLCHKYKNSNCVFLTLTLDPKKYDSLPDMWLAVKKEQNRFLTSLRNHLKKRGRKLPPYLSSIECQHGEKSWLNPHIHIVFLDCKRLIDWREIRSIWNLGHVWINRTKQGRKIRKPIDYLTKYITKTYTDSSNCNFRDQAIQWFFNVRSFSYSRGLLFPINFSNGGFVKLFHVFCESHNILNWFEDNIKGLVDGYILNFDLKRKLAS